MATPEEVQPANINPYEVLSIETTASADQVKSAYRRAALKWHPDKVEQTTEAKAAAHKRFTQIAYAYAVLSDSRRRKRYDDTGRTDEAIGLDDDFDWLSFYRSQFADIVTESTIKTFSDSYKGGHEERAALLANYTKFEGNMSKVYNNVMLSDPAEDDDRFREIINEAIAKGEVAAFDKFTKEKPATIKARKAKAKKQAQEAESLARLFADRKNANAPGRGNGPKLPDLSSTSSRRGKSSGKAGQPRAAKASRGRKDDTDDSQQDDDDDDEDEDDLSLQDDEDDDGDDDDVDEDDDESDDSVDEPPEEAFAANRAKGKGTDRSRTEEKEKENVDLASARSERPRASRMAAKREGAPLSSAGRTKTKRTKV